jgi:hypothetical protein
MAIIIRPRNTRKKAKKDGSISRLFAYFAGEKKLSRNKPVTGSAAKIAMSEKALFLSGKAFPTDISALVRRGNERVVVLHLAVTLHAADRKFVDGLRVDSFNHDVPLFIQLEAYSR